MKTHKKLERAAQKYAEDKRAPIHNIDMTFEAGAEWASKAILRECKKSAPENGLLHGVMRSYIEAAFGTVEAKKK